MGSAMNAKEEVSVSLTELKDRLRQSIKLDFEVERMEPLFATEEDYQAFHDRQAAYKVSTGDLESYKGNCYLGIDAGSTTTKTALVGEDGSLLYSFYSNNNGSPLKTAIRSIQEIYSRLPDDAHIAYSCSTGYGEALVKAALLLDEGEVETVAHYYAAAFFDPEVDCILDIGGQDMKCIKIKNQTVRQRTAERSLLFRMRLLYRDFCQISELQRAGLREGRAFREAPHRPGNKMHRIYEFQSKAGPEGGRGSIRHLRRTCLFGNKERAL